MNIEELRNYCLSLPSVEEDIKWEDNLCFLVGNKIFCISALEAPLAFSIKVGDEAFEELVELDGVSPSPYLARYKWIRIEEMTTLSDTELKRLIDESYQLIRSKLSKKKRDLLST